MRYKYNMDVAITREYVEIKARIRRKHDIYVQYFHGLGHMKHTLSW